MTASALSEAHVWLYTSDGQIAVKTWLVLGYTHENNPIWCMLSENTQSFKPSSAWIIQLLIDPNINFQQHYGEKHLHLLIALYHKANSTIEINMWHRHMYSIKYRSMNLYTIGFMWFCIIHMPVYASVMLMSACFSVYCVLWRLC